MVKGKPEAPAEEGSKFNNMVGNPEGEGESGLPAVPAGATRVYTDTPDLAMEDISFPRLRLAQGLTSEVAAGDATPGQWLVTGYDPEDDVVLIPLKMAKLREYRDKENNEVLCSSPDAVVGIGNPGGECARCPLAHWQDTADGRLAPTCTFIYSYVAWSVTHQVPVSIDLKKTGINAAKFINTRVTTQGLGNFAVALSSASKSKGQRRWNEPVVHLADFPQEERDKAIAAMGGDSSEE